MDQFVEVLLVEDDIDDANLTIRALKKNHLVNNIFHVRDGEEALDFIYGLGKYAGMHLSENLRLILLDVKMPKVSGIEVLKKIKSEESTKKIPIIMLTASKEDPDIKTCYEFGVNSYIVKPVGFEQFLNMVAGLGLYWMKFNQPSN